MEAQSLQVRRPLVYLSVLVEDAAFSYETDFCLLVPCSLHSTQWVGGGPRQAGCAVEED